MEQPRQPAVSPTGEPNPDEVLRRKPKTLQIILVVTTVLLVLCCGGVAIAGVIDNTKNEAPTPPASASHSAGPSPSATMSVPPTNSVFATTPSGAPSPSGPASASGAVSPPGAVSTAPLSPVPTSPGAVLPPAQPTLTTAAPVAPPTTNGLQLGVHPGALCSPAGAMGQTADGRLMRCRRSIADSRNRWRAA